MNAHTETQFRLYEYLRGDLDEKDRASPRGVCAMPRRM